MTEPSPEQLLAGIRALALSGGEEILKFYRGKFEVRQKTDFTPVTEADEAAEALIVAGLRALAPHIPVVAEEEMAAGHREDISGGRYWLVDALDGTREFVNHRDEFTVNIALIEDTRPVMGVVHAPAQGVTYWAHGPRTAMVARSGAAPLSISARHVPAGGAVAVASRSHGDPEEMQKLAGNITISEVKTSGSSIKFCMIAEGAADIYARYGHTREWDTAAAHAVLAGAGGSVRDAAGVELAYAKPDFLNPPFIARGRET